MLAARVASKLNKHVNSDIKPLWTRGTQAASNSKSVVSSSTRSTALAPPYLGSNAGGTYKSKLRWRRMAVLSPRSNNYERLEGGMGPNRMGKQRFAWRKFILAAAAIIGLVWLLGPRERRSFSWMPNDDELTRPQHGGNQLATLSQPVPTSTVQYIDHPPPAMPHHGASDTASNPHSASFDTDPDPSKTTHCISPYKPDGPLVQYALMIDAGSTGSRIHIYKFNNCGPSATYEYEVFKMTQPGLSSFAGQPEDAASSLDVLMQEAVRIVPESLHTCTPVAVKATAGLRLLPGSQSADILDAVKKSLHSKYPFKLNQQDGVVIMDGKDEGVYAWITANYLLGAIRADSRDTSTYAVLDLGGASTQIVFEPKSSKPDSTLVDGDHKYDLRFAGKTHVLYQHSYLGYGLMHARMHVHRLVDFMDSLRTKSNDEANSPVGNPCLAKGQQRVVVIEDDKTKVKKNVTMDGEEIGAFEACNRIVQLVLAKDAICTVKPCSFDGVYQPSLMDTFPTGKVLLLSYFYDRLHPLLPENGPITISTIADTARDVCRGRSEWLKRWGANHDLILELEGRPEWCLDLTFMYGLLRLGYEFEDTRLVTIGKKLQNTELGWCLGATLAMVGGEMKCRV